MYKILCALLLCSLMTGCTIENDESKDGLVELRPSDLEMHKDAFSALTLKCIKGDLSSLDEIMSMYMRSAADMKSDRGMALFELAPNKNFEKCAIKAYETGDDRAFNMIVRSPNLASHISRYFYKRYDLLNGAYWAQRVLNMQGLADGYETLGSVFIKDRKTLATGASMLEQSVRLGNYNALSILRIASNQYNENYFKAKDRRLKRLSDKASTKAKK